MMMEINLRKIPIHEYHYKGIVEYPEEDFKTTGILRMSPVNLEFSIFPNNDQEDVLNLSGSGTLYLEDARTLEEVPYPYEVHLEEKIEPESEFCGRFLENSQNTLDILDILWENIVLEIPISYTVSDELEETKTKEEEMIDPRLAPLMELLKEKE